MIAYFKALHIIFIVTWFAGMFYIVRLFIYNTEARDKPELESSVLHKQFSIMIKRLWLGITWPSAILTLIFGPLVWYYMFNLTTDNWMLLKLAFVILLYIYHFTLHKIYNQQLRGEFRYSSNQLRIWNEVATILLVCIVMLVVVKNGMSLVWGIIGLTLFIGVLMGAIRIYKLLRSK